MEAVACRCSKCGQATDWDESLGSEPLCAVCWDSEADVVTPAEREALYREAHKDEIQGYRRVYAEAHKEEIKAYRKRFVESHRAELLLYWRRYHQANRCERLESMKIYSREYYLRNKEQIVLRKREYRKARSCSQGCKTERSVSVP